MATEKVRNCRSCSEPMPAHARFCPACGAKAIPPCPACGYEVSVNDRFCPQCGTAQNPTKRETTDQGEHRQITVMFCDVVGSTRLSLEADVEDLREILRRYQDICASAVEKNAGVVAQYLGDGVVAYFGYPVSAEDAPVWAADAALQIIRGVEDMNAQLAGRFGVEIKVRIGMHAGRVLVGEMGAGRTRAPNTATGAVPNIAARVESCAPENGIAVSADVRDRIAAHFEMEDLGTQDLKGVNEPLRIYHLKGRSRARRGIEISEDLHLVGREQELHDLLAVWADVRDKETSRVVSLVGEPGIGKSGILSRFFAESACEPNQVIYFSGSAADQNSPFASLLGMLERELDLRHDYPEESDNARIRDWFARQGCNDTLAADAMVDLRHSRAATDEQSSQGAEARAEIFAAFRNFMRERTQPALLVAEDAHWIDPSTLEMISEATRGETAARFMLLTVSRPNHGIPWQDRTDRTIELAGLNETACARLMAHVAGAKTTEPALVSHIVEISNGVPLFVQELTRSMIEEKLAHVASGRLRMSAIAVEARTPGTLLDLLMARLDSLGEAKALGQIAAALGRVVSVAALAAVAKLSVEDFSQALDTLIAADVISYAAEPGLVQFRHALFQKAAYETLLRRRRAAIHGAYVDWLDKNQDKRRSITPQELGFHCFGAGRFERAAGHYCEAGLIASRASANREAARHFQRSLDAFEALPGADRPAEAVLEMNVRFAGAVLGAEGPGAEVTTDAYERAIEISEQTPGSRWHFPAYWGWWRISSNFPQMSERATRIVAVAERMDDPEFKLQAHHCMWANCFHVGALDESLEHARRGLGLYQPGRSAEQGILYGGHDPKVCAHGEIALVGWLQGGGDTSRTEIERAIVHAEQLGHQGSLLHALDIAATLHCHRRDPVATHQTAQRLIQTGMEQHIEEYLAKGRFFQGWVKCANGDIAEGLKAMDAAYDVMKIAATNEDFPFFQCLRAEGLRALGDTDAARAALSEARDIVAGEGVTYWDAELARQQAETEMCVKVPDEDRVAALLGEARTKATKQGAHALVLRAALSEAAWAHGQGRGDKHIADLSTVIGAAPEGAHGHDLRLAQALLKELDGDKN